MNTLYLMNELLPGYYLSQFFTCTIILTLTYLKLFLITTEAAESR
jgi:hypothetical protein